MNKKELSDLQFNFNQISERYTNMLEEFYESVSGESFEDIKDEFEVRNWHSTSKIIFSTKKNLVTIQLVYLQPVLNGKEVVLDKVAHKMEFRNQPEGHYNEYIEIAEKTTKNIK